MRRSAAAFCVTIGLTAMLAGRVQADALKPGQPAPDFKGLVGVDDKDHSLSDYGQAKLVVVVFICNHCPVARGYEDRLIALQKQYKPKGVQFVAINVNNVPADRLAEMKKCAKMKEFNFPYLYDPTQKVGHEFGATVTPHVFLLDRDRKLAYVGAIDDSLSVKKVKHHYLHDALNALLEGKSPPKAVTQQFGCAIKYE